jgi:hypothetical protein
MNCEPSGLLLMEPRFCKVFDDDSGPSLRAHVSGKAETDTTWKGMTRIKLKGSNVSIESGGEGM